MNYASFKKNQVLKYHSINSAIKVKTMLTGLSLNGEKNITEAGTPYQCTLVPQSGKYLPRTIDITGTKSRYAFKYDYTTGVIYIPSGEIYEDITVIAEADDINNNVPAVLQVQKRTLDHYIDGTKYSNQSFLALYVTPSRGSTVSITFGGLTKTIIGNLPTNIYDSTAQLVVFGTYGTVDDGTTATSGELTIKGAYESYSIGAATNNKGLKKYARFFTGITELGAIRYLSGPLSYNGSLADSNTLTFQRELDDIKSEVGASESDTTILTLVFNKNVNNISAVLTDSDGSSGDDGYCQIDAYFNNINWDWWAQGNRQYYTYYHSRSDSNYCEEYVIPYINGVKYDAISSISLSNKCKVIGHSAFAYFKALTNITLPDTVEQIGETAFCYSGLESIILSNSLVSIGTRAFMGANIKSIAIPDSATSIGDEAFTECENMTSLFIPKNVTTLGKHLCSPMDGFTLTISDESLAYSAEDNVIYNKNKTTLIDGYMFTQNNLVIRDTVTKIESEGFRSNIYLESVTIPSSVTTFGKRAFNKCSSLTSVTFKDGLQSIGEDMFYECPALTSVNIPGSVKTIGSSAFGKCTALSSVTLNYGIKEIDRWAFGVTDIKAITLPDSVITIGDQAFTGCDSLTSVTLNEGLVSIGSQAFWSTDALTSIVIPSTVTQMGNNCFSYATNLAKITMRPTTPPECDPFGDGTGENMNPPEVSYQIVVPAGCGAAYKAATGWSYYADHIVEAS